MLINKRKLTTIEVMQLATQAGLGATTHRIKLLSWVLLCKYTNKIGRMRQVRLAKVKTTLVMAANTL